MSKKIYDKSGNEIGSFSGDYNENYGFQVELDKKSEKIYFDNDAKYVIIRPKSKNATCSLYLQDTNLWLSANDSSLKSVKRVADPTDQKDAANKDYVDKKIKLVSNEDEAGDEPGVLYIW